MGYKIAFSGASGIGKTTLANWLSSKLNLPFVSSSMSDLLPETKGINQSELVANPNFDNEVLLLNKRHSLYNSYMDGFVTDRSYLDSMAYLLIKLSHKLDSKDVRAFMQICREYLIRDFTHLILLDYSGEALSTWNLEDNKKRVTNPYFQFMVGSAMRNILVNFYEDGQEYKVVSWWLSSNKVISIVHKDSGRSLDIIIMKELELQQRKHQILSFLNQYPRLV